MTAQDMINTVKDNLGNRASGRIGNRAVDTVVLEAINLAVPHITLEAQPDYYNRTATVSLTTSSQVYNLPTVDSDGVDIRVKDIVSYRCYRSDGTPIMLEQIPFVKFVRLAPDYEQAIEGIPTYFSLWGSSNKIYLNNLPSEALTLKLFVEVYPTLISSSNLNSPLAIDDQWLLAVEAFATQHCYLKLQQTQMYTIWNDLYLKQKGSLSRNEDRKHGHGMQVGQSSGYVSDPVLDPTVTGWN
jgi:hypothetical protein